MVGALLSENPDRYRKVLLTRGNDKKGTLELLNLSGALELDGDLQVEFDPGVSAQIING